MNDFLYLYRLPSSSTYRPDSAREMQERLQKWTAWFKELDGASHLGNLGHPLASGGAVVKARKGAVTDGPYAESKDLVIGYTVVRATDLAQATELASGCPVLDYGGCVEVRPIHAM